MLTSRTKYATRALLELALHYEEKGSLTIQEIATRQNIPVKFLEQILAALKMLGYIDSRRGPGGGYTLRRPPEEIFLGDVIRSIEGPVAPISCVSVTQYQACGCPEPETCALRQVFKEARDAIANVLDSASYKDLIDRGGAIRGLIELNR